MTRGFGGFPGHLDHEMPNHYPGPVFRKAESFSKINQLTGKKKRYIIIICRQAAARMRTAKRRGTEVAVTGATRNRLVGESRHVGSNPTLSAINSLKIQ